MALVAGKRPFSEVEAELKELPTCHEGSGFSGGLQRADYTSCLSLKELL